VVSVFETLACLLAWFLLACQQIFSFFPLSSFSRLFFVLCSLSANFLIFLLIIVLSVVLFYVCLIVLCLIVGKFSNSDCQYRQTNKPTIHACIVVHCACLLPIVLVMVNCSFSLIQRINKVLGCGGLNHPCVEADLRELHFSLVRMYWSSSLLQDGRHWDICRIFFLLFNRNLTRIGLTWRHMSPNTRLSESSNRCTLTFFKIG